MTNRKYIANVWIDDHAVYAKTTDGIVASYEFARWPRLRNATDSERHNYVLSYGGIHWPYIDEDLSFEGMFHDSGLCDITTTEDSVFYHSYSICCGRAGRLLKSPVIDNKHHSHSILQCG